MRYTAFPVMTLALSAAILGVYGLELQSNDGIELCERFGFVAASPSLATALTSLLFHDPAGWSHVAGNLLVLVLVGSRVEQAIGSWRFAGLFAAGGIAGAGLHVVVDPGSLSPLVGCSGALFAVLVVAAALYGPGMLAFVAVLVAINIAHAFGGPGAEGVSFGAHIGGFTLGVFLVMLARCTQSLAPRVALSQWRVSFSSTVRCWQSRRFLRASRRHHSCPSSLRGVRSAASA